MLTIWGFFLLLRFPHDDWFLLPVLETLYYAVGTFLETRTMDGAVTSRPGPRRP